MGILGGYVVNTAVLYSRMVCRVIAQMRRSPKYHHLPGYDAWEGPDADPVTPPDDAGGLTKIGCIDTVIPQGPPGVRALDGILRECLHCENGGRIHRCVSYSLLRLQIMQYGIVQMSRVLIPDQYLLYVEPTAAPPPLTAAEGDTAVYMRVRLFKFLVLPVTAKRKTPDTGGVYYEEDGADEMCPYHSPPSNQFTLADAGSSSSNTQYPVAQSHSSDEWLPGSSSSNTQYPVAQSHISDKWLSGSSSSNTLRHRAR
jgi:hypothetical protein